MGSSVIYPPHHIIIIPSRQQISYIACRLIDLFLSKGLHTGKRCFVENLACFFHAIFLFMIMCIVMAE